MQYLRRQRQRSDVSQYAALIETPAVAPFALPANGRVAFKAVSDIVAGQPLATIQGKSTRNIGSKGLSTGQSQILDFVEEGATVTLQATVEMFVDTGLGLFKKIAQG
jgi:hypothetical protein